MVPRFETRRGSTEHRCGQEEEKEREDGQLGKLRRDVLGRRHAHSVKEPQRERRSPHTR